MTTDQPCNHPDRACTDDYRYAEVLLTKGAGTKEDRARMAKACLACADYLDCLEDVIAAGKAWEFHEAQAWTNLSPGHQTARPHPPE